MRPANSTVALRVTALLLCGIARSDDKEPAPYPLPEVRLTHAEAGVLRLKMFRAFREHQFEKAAAAAEALIAAGQTDRKTLETATNAHLAANQFADAGRCAAALDDRNWIDPRREFPLRELSDCGRLWDKELDLRKKDASGEEASLPPRVLITTSAGEIELELYEDQAPQAVNHLVWLIEKRKYDGSRLSSSPDGYVVAHDVDSQGKDAALRYSILPRSIAVDDPVNWECYSSDARRSFAGSVTLDCYGCDAYGSELRIAWMPQMILNEDIEMMSRDWPSEKEGAQFLPIPCSPRLDDPAIFRAEDIGQPPSLFHFIAWKDPVGSPGFRISRGGRDAEEPIHSTTDASHTVCGRVVRNLGTLARLSDGGQILSATVLRKRDHRYVPRNWARQPADEDNGDFQNAISSAKAAVRAESRSGRSTQGLLRARNRLGIQLLNDGNLIDARRELEQGLSAFRKSGEPVSGVVAELQNNLGVALFRDGKWRESITPLAEALRIRRELFGDSHIDTLQSFVNLAAVRRQLPHPKANPEPDDADRRRAATEDKEPNSEEEAESRLHTAAYAMEERLNTDQQTPSPTSAELIEIVEAEMEPPSLRLLAFDAEFGVVAGKKEGAAQKDSLEPEEKPAPIEREPAKALAINRLGLLMHLASGYGTEDAFASAAAIYADAYGPKHLQTALALNNLAAVPFRADDISQPDPLNLARLEHALSAVRAALPESHRLEGVCRQNLGLCLLRIPERRAEAREHLEVARDIFKNSFSLRHPRHAMAIEAVGYADFLMGDYVEAAAHFDSAAQTFQQCFGEENPFAASALNSAGVAQFKLGNLQIAREKLERALAIRRKVLGKSDPHTHQSLSDLAVVLRSEGDYVNALRFLEEAAEANGVATIRNNLWALRLEMGDYETARQHFSQQLKDENPEPSDRRDALINLGTLNWLEGKLNEARSLFEEARALDPEDDAVLNGLGALTCENGDLQTAKSCLEKALRLRTRMYGGKGPRIAASLNSLAIVAQREGDSEKARSLLERSLQMCIDECGERSPATIEACRLLGQCELMAGDLPAARDHLSKALEYRIGMARDLLPVLTEAEALAYTTGFRERDLFLSALTPESDAATAYEAVWNSRALATRTIAARRNLATGPRGKAVQSQLNRVRSDLATRLLSAKGLAKGPGPVETENEGESLWSLTSKKEQLEKELMRLSPNYRREADQERTSSEDFLKMLPADVAVIDIVRTRRYEPAPAAGDANYEKVSWQYEAFVLRGASATGSGDAPHAAWLHLGPAAPIDKSLDDWRLLLVGAHTGARGPDWDRPVPKEEAGRPLPQTLLRKQIWEPLEPHLANALTIVIIPDGALARLPWAALPGRSAGGFLAEEYRIATATHAQQIAALLQSEPAGFSTGLLVGGVQYDSVSRPPEPGLLARTRGQKPDPDTRWMPLQASLIEIKEIESLAPRSVRIHRLTDRNASEGAVRDILPKCQWAHLSTHGFFAGEEVVSAFDAESLSKRPGSAARDLLPTVLDRPAVLSSLVGRNPLALSGVVLAGANQQQAIDPFGYPEGDDGVFTAAEIAGLDLKATQLVVLSACDTGLGPVAGGEGVLGLQRAFSLAGAKTVVCSLWAIDDDAARFMMREFYRELWQNRCGKLEALVRAQRTMLTRYDVTTKQLTAQSPGNTRTKTDPFYWAAFSLCGDWR